MDKAQLQLVEPVIQQMNIGLNQDALDEWIEYREDKKKPLSALALKKTTNLLLKHDEDHQQHMVDCAIMNDWQGLHDVDPVKKATTRDESIRHQLTDTSWAD